MAGLHSIWGRWNSEQTHPLLAPAAALALRQLARLLDLACGLSELRARLHVQFEDELALVDVGEIDHDDVGHEGLQRDTVRVVGRRDVGRQPRFDRLAEAGHPQLGERGRTVVRPPHGRVALPDAPLQAGGRPVHHPHHLGVGAEGADLHQLTLRLDVGRDLAHVAVAVQRVRAALADVLQAVVAAAVAGAVREALATPDPGRRKVALAGDFGDTLRGEEHDDVLLQLVERLLVEAARACEESVAELPHADLRDDGPVRAFVELQEQEFAAVVFDEVLRLFQHIHEPHAERAVKRQLGGGDVSLPAAQVEDDLVLLILLVYQLRVGMEGLQQHRRGGHGRTLGCRDPQVEQAHAGLGLLEDFEVLGLDVGVAARDARVVAAGEDDVAEPLAAAQHVVSDHGRRTSDRKSAYSTQTERSFHE